MPFPMMQRYFSSEKWVNQVKTILAAGSGGLFVRVLSLIATLLSSVVLARALGADSFGLYVFALSVTSLLSIPIQMGVPTLVVRETASADAVQDWPAIESIRVWALRWNMTLGLFMAGAFIGVAIIFADQASDQKWVYILAAAIILPLAITGTFGAALRGLRHIVLGQLPIEVLRPFAIVAVIFVIWTQTDYTLDTTLALSVNLVATILAGLVAMLFLRKRLGKRYKTGTPYVFQNRAWAKAIVPIALMSGLHIINQNLDLMMIGVMRTNAEVGEYKIAVSAATFVIFGLSAIQLVAMPYVSRYFKKKNFGELQKLASLSALASIIMAAPVMALFAVYGDVLIRVIYGQEFANALSPLIILSIAQLINGFFGIVWPLLVMTGNEQAGFRGLLISTSVNVSLNLALIPTYGASGAAVATGCSIVVWNILFWWSVWRHLKIDASILGLLRLRHYGA